MLLTSADPANFPDDGKRRELINGELYVTAQPHWFHQVACTRIGGFLSAWCDESEHGEAAYAPGLIFDEYNDVAPDIVWASNGRLAAILRRGKLFAAPELIIEVLSPGRKNIARDRDTKPKLYARRGVDEYWIADWPRHAVEVYRRQGATLRLVATFGPGDTLTTPLLPDFALSLDRLYAGFPFADALPEEDE